MTKDLQKQIGLKIYRARKKADLTQEELAEAVDKAPETISNIERGHVLTGLDTLQRIGIVLKVPLRDFFDADDNVRKVDAKRGALEGRLLGASTGLSLDRLRDLVGIATLFKRSK
jgi:transcriptional regulator with XRE-family HTH domain